MFELKEEEMELGLGIHGEIGYERIHFTSARELIDLLISKIEKNKKFSLEKG